MLGNRSCRLCSFKRVLGTKIQFKQDEHPIREQANRTVDKTIEGAERVGERVREASEEMMEGGRRFWDRLKETVIEGQPSEVPTIGERGKGVAEKVKEQFTDKAAEAKGNIENEPSEIKGEMANKAKKKMAPNDGEGQEMKIDLEDRGYNK